MNRLDELHDHILLALKNGIPDLQTCVEALDDNKVPQRRLSLAVPALLVSLLNLEAEASDGTERLILKTDWQVTCLASGTTTTERQRAARSLALQVASLVQFNRFSIGGVEPALLQGLKPIEFDDELKYSLGAWVVTWTHRITLGDSVWQAPKLQVERIVLNENVTLWKAYV